MHIVVSHLHELFLTLTNDPLSIGHQSFGFWFSLTRLHFVVHVRLPNAPFERVLWIHGMSSIPQLSAKAKKRPRRASSLSYDGDTIHVASAQPKAESSFAVQSPRTPLKETAGGAKTTKRSRIVTHVGSTPHETLSYSKDNKLIQHS